MFDVDRNSRACISWLSDLGQRINFRIEISASDNPIHHLESKLESVWFPSIDLSGNCLYFIGAMKGNLIDFRNLD